MIIFEQYIGYQLHKTLAKFSYLLYS